MYIVHTFTIDDGTKTRIFVPSVENKLNSYYRPTKILNVLDEVTVKLITNNQEIILEVDNCRDTFDQLKQCLEKALNNQLIPAFTIETGHMGYQYNLDTYCDQADSAHYTDFGMWASI